MKKNFIPFQKISNIENNKESINPLVLDVYNSFNVKYNNINIYLNNFFKSDCALCKHALFHNNINETEEEELETFNIFCLLIRQDLTHQMRTNEDREIYFENMLRNVKRCSQCAIYERQD